MSKDGEKPGSLIAPATDKAIASLLDSLLGPAASGLGGLLSDQVAYWRAANLERLKTKWLKDISGEV